MMHPEDPRSAELLREWLHRFVGSWSSEGRVTTAAGAEQVIVNGRINGRTLGGRWLVMEYAADLPGGGRMTAVQTVGFDAQAGHYVGTWVDSTADHLWQYAGRLSDDGRTLTLTARGPDMGNPGQTAEYRDAYTVESPDHVVAVSSMKQAGGPWVTFMTADLRRTE